MPGDYTARIAGVERQIGSFGEGVVNLSEFRDHLIAELGAEEMPLLRRAPPTWICWWRGQDLIFVSPAA